MTLRPMSDAHRALRKRWGLADDDPGPTSLPKKLFPEDRARRLNEARWGRSEAVRQGNDGGIPEYCAEVSGQEGSDALFGGSGHDKLGSNDPEYRSNSPSLRLETDLPSLDDRVIAGSAGRPRLEPDMDAILADRASKNVTYYRLRTWPVPGEGRAPLKGEIGPNGHIYSDGRYSPEGDYRVDEKGRPKAHQGIDLPAKIGSPVVVADDGVVSRVDTQRIREGARKGQKGGWGDYVVVDHADGTSGLYAHLSPEGRPAAGTHVKRGQKIGTVGGTGNAKTQGDHVHYEVTRSGTGVRMDPTEWMRRKRVSMRNRMDD